MYGHQNIARAVARKCPTSWMLGAWLAAFLGVVIVSLLPETNPIIGGVSSTVTNIAHIPSFALLTLLTALVAARFVRISGVVLAVIALTVTSFGILIELMQPSVGRTASLIDVALDVLGVGLAAGSYYVWMSRRLPSSA